MARHYSAKNSRTTGGLAELKVFYCESCMNLLGIRGMDDEGNFYALVRMFKRSLKAIASLEPDPQENFVERLERVRHQGHHWGWAWAMTWTI